MKNYFFAFSLIFFTYIANAQSYRTIKSDSIYLFSNNNGNIIALRVDSIAINAQDTILFNFKTIRQNDSIYDCFTPSGASWIGKYIIIKPNGINLFFNKTNDTIIIKTQALLLESWKCFSFTNGNYIDAYISSINTASFLGLTDSVKTISFQLKNSSGVSLPHTINNFQISISKFHGLIDLFEFYLFPDVSDVYSIIGGPNMQGKKNLTYQEVYDYNIGDEFHSEYYHGYLSGSYYATTKTSIYKVIDKYNISNNSVTYVYSRCEKDINRINADIQISYFYDTITSTIVFTNSDNQIFNHLPDETIYKNGNTEISSLSMDFTMNNRIQKTLPSQSGFINFIGDSCWNRIMYNGCYIAMRFIEGCGGSYYECSYGLNESYNHLLYYKKGSEQWGTPLDCATLLGIDSYKNNTKKSAEIFPNPMNENSKLRINNFIRSPYVLQIYNCLGEVKYKKIITENETVLNLKNLGKGVYFYVLYDSSGNTNKDKIIIE